MIIASEDYRGDDLPDVGSLENRMSRVISDVKLSDKLALTECNDGWWLYDYTREMNLSMRAKTAQDALVETIKYYQGRLTDVEHELKTLRLKVEAFVEEVHKCPDGGEN